MIIFFGFSRGTFPSENLEWKRLMIMFLCVLNLVEPGYISLTPAYLVNYCISK